MDISLAKVKDIGVGIVCLGLLGYVLYLGYGIFFGSAGVSGGVASVNAGLLGPKLQKGAATLNDPNKKISFKQKDLSFTEGLLYKSFITTPELVPLSDKRGRPDPFVPYATP